VGPHSAPLLGIVPGQICPQLQMRRRRGRQRLQRRLGTLLGLLDHAGDGSESAGLMSIARVLLFNTGEGVLGGRDAPKRSEEVEQGEEETSQDLLRNVGIAHALVQPALAGGDLDAARAQPGQGQRDLLAVAAADAVGQHVDAVAGGEQVERGLGDADVGLDADEHGVERLLGHAGGGGRRGHDLGRPHAEARLVGVDGRLDAVGRVQAQLRARLAQLGARLRRREDGDREDLALRCEPGSHAGGTDEVEGEAGYMGG
jgi:hypothetical protein